MPDPLFNVQTIDPETGGEEWVTVQAADAERARSEASLAAHARTGVNVVIGEIRPVDERVIARVAADEELDAIPLAPSDAPIARKPCAVCGAPMGHDSRVCGICGHDSRVGFESSRLARSTFSQNQREVTCHGCGYDLRGLPSGTCPECGVSNAHSLASRWVDHAPGLADKLKNWTPVIAFGVGFGVSMAVGLSTSTILIELLLHGLMIPLGFALVAACALLWLGNDTTWGMLFVRVAAIYAVAHAVGAGLRMLIPVQFLISGIQLFLTMFIAVWLLDLDDMIDGAILGLILWITWFFATLFLFQVVLAP